MLLASAGAVSAAADSFSPPAGGSEEGRLVLAQLDPATAATAAAAGAGAAIASETAEKAAEATQAATEVVTEAAGDAAAAAGEAASEMAAGAAEATGDAASDAMAKAEGAFAELGRHLTEAKGALDSMVEEVIVASGLDKMDLTPNQVYGIAVGAVGGALLADAFGATGLATLGMAAAAAAVGGYVTDAEAVEQ
jgi:hypothetical protein